MNTSKISIFIVDDHPLIRQALKVSIQTESDMDVVGVAVNGVEAIEKIPALMPNVVIMDLMMPNMSGQEAITELRRICPALSILVLSSLENEEAIFKAVRAGARGYLTKDAESETLLEAIRSVSEGKSYLPEGIMEKLMEGVRQNVVKEKLPDSAFDSLTKREKEVLDLLGKGYSNAKIGANMDISASTVRVYLHHIMRKMGFENQHEAVIFSSSNGFYGLVKKETKSS